MKQYFYRGWKRAFFLCHAVVNSATKSSLGNSLRCSQMYVYFFSKRLKACRHLLLSRSSNFIREIFEVLCFVLDTYIYCSLGGKFIVYCIFILWTELTRIRWNLPTFLNICLIDHKFIVARQRHLKWPLLNSLYIH